MTMMTMIKFEFTSTTFGLLLFLFFYYSGSRNSSQWGEGGRALRIRISSS